MVKDTKTSKLFFLLKLTRPDWYFIVTGVFFYGAIGACYPIIGALVAQVNEVSSAVLCLLLCDIFNRLFYFRY